MLIYAIAFLLLYTGIDIYTGVRLLGLLKFFFPDIKILVFWLLYIVTCYSMLPLLLLRFNTVGLYSFPLILYFMFTLLFFDLLYLIFRFLRCPVPPAYTAAGTGIALGLAILVMFYGAIHSRNIQTVHYSVELKSSQPSSNLRLVLVSDMHIGAVVTRKWVSNIVDAVNEAKPDIICLAGDTFDFGPQYLGRDLNGIISELKELNAPLGVYACQGNHDVDRISFKQNLNEADPLTGIKSALEKAGIVLLLDESALVDKRFYLTGRRDARPIGMNYERKSAADLTAGLDKSIPIIFLDHQPVDFENEEEVNAGLILCGHTHRGQFFPGNIITSLIFKKAGGVDYGYWQGKSAQAIVSSGAGIWGPPIRIGTQSEIAVIDIHFSGENP